MAKTTQGDLKELTFGAGVDNISTETKLGKGYARKADNVDINNDGTISVREGYSLFAPLRNAHSLWSNDLMPFALVADNTTLYKMDDSGALTALVDGMDGSDVGYAVVANRVYWANSSRTGIVKLSGSILPWGVENPMPSFTLTAVANGGLAAGVYGVAMTFSSASREESGAYDTTYVTVPEGGGIQVNSVPRGLTSTPIEARIYMTTANGTDLMYASSAMPGATAFLLGAGQLGRPLTTQFLEPFPPVRYPTAKAGRLFGVYQDRMLVWSEPLYYGLYHPTMNFIRLPDPITMIAVPESDQFIMYIGTSKKVYAFRGASVAEATLSIVSHNGAIPGSMAMIPQNVINLRGVVAPVPMWAGAEGVPYAGTETGIVGLSSVFVYPLYDKAAAIFVQRDGYNRYIVSGRGGRASGLAATDTAVATVYDNGGGL